MNYDEGFGPFDPEEARALRTELVDWTKTSHAFYEISAREVCEVILPALDMVLARPPYHVADFREDGWTIQHPLAEGDELFSCRFNQAVAASLPASGVGRYRVELSPVLGILIVVSPERREDEDA